MEQINSQQSLAYIWKHTFTGEEAGGGAKRLRAALANGAKVGEKPAAGRRPKRWRQGSWGRGLCKLGLNLRFQLLS